MVADTTIISLQADIKNGLTSCVERVANYLVAIDKNKHLNSFLEVFEIEARKQAISIDQKINAGSAGKLAGLVIAIKDNICYKDHQVSASSKMLNGFNSLFSSTVVERLLNEDAIIIGRLNCDEFAMGSSNENSAFGNVLNPINNTKIPGGSSGGAAATFSAGAARSYMATIDTALNTLNGWRADFGSTQNQLESAIRNQMTQQTNIKAAESVIRDVDYAAESANFNKQNIIAQAGTYAMSQANAVQQNVTRLLQ